MRRALCIAWGLLAAGTAWAQQLANGVFLVAQPSLTSPPFNQSVVLITQRPDGGSLGVIVNRPSSVALRDAFPKHDKLAALPQTLHFGGPVQPRALLFLVRATTAPPGAIAILRDVYLTHDIDWVNSALSDGKQLSALRVYAGYAGWAPRQLRSEIERQGWYVLPADSAAIFDKDGAELWHELSKRAVLRTTSQ